MDEWDIRYSRLEDEKFLLQWLQEPDNLQWFPMKTQKEIKQTARNWIGFAKFNGSLTATINNKPCGIVTLFFMPYRKVAHQSSFYLLVDKKYRNKGVGFSLLKNLINLSKNYFRLESLQAEIYEGCPIENLLKTFGFTSFAYQEKFIKDEKGYKARNLLELFLKDINLNEYKKN